jgi:hypothetical protein
MPETTQQQQQTPPKPRWKPRAGTYRKLLLEKFVPETQREYVLASIIVELAENVDKVASAAVQLGLQDQELGEAIEAVAAHVFGAEEQPQAQSATSAAPGPQAQQAAEEPAEGHPPFPTGVTPTVVQNGTGPLPDDEDAEIPRPSAPQPARNAAPIPTPADKAPKQARNGQR